MTTHRIRITWMREMEIDVKRTTTHNDVQRMTGIDKLPIDGATFIDWLDGNQPKLKPCDARAPDHAWFTVNSTRWATNGQYLVSEHAPALPPVDRAFLPWWAADAVGPEVAAYVTSIAASDLASASVHPGWFPAECRDLFAGRRVVAVAVPGGTSAKAPTHAPAAVVDPEHGLIAIVMPLWARAPHCVRVTP